MMGEYFDTTSTIAAVSTPQGIGALGIVRISGSESRNIIRGLFKPMVGHPSTYTPRRSYYGELIDADGTVIDDVCLIYMEAPHSFSGEDMVEITCHGNPIILDKALKEVCRNADVRLAQPGEFSFRAFLNGKMDLLQAESLCQLIHAKSEKALSVARNCFRGHLRERLLGMRDRLKEALVYLEADIEFGDDLDGSSLPEVTTILKDSINAFEALLEQYARGRFLFEEVRAVIVGKPNVGKSSLLNSLAGERCAIVADMPGTTRDAISISISMGGFQIKLVDTAGFRHKAGPIEQLGIDMMLEQIEGANVILLVLDGSGPLEAIDYELLEMTNHHKRIVVKSKSDLPTPWKAAFPVVEVSATEKRNLEQLRGALIQETIGESDVRDEAFIFNRRQEEGIESAMAALRRGLDGLGSGQYLDVVSEEVRQAIAALEFLVGGIRSDEVLREIFGRFCIGK